MTRVVNAMGREREITTYPLPAEGAAQMRRRLIVLTSRLWENHGAECRMHRGMHRSVQRDETSRCPWAPTHATFPHRIFSAEFSLQAASGVRTDARRNRT